jgi:hypothetical protein
MKQKTLYKFVRQRLIEQIPPMMLPMMLLPMEVMDGFALWLLPSSTHTLGVSIPHMLFSWHIT